MVAFPKLPSGPVGGAIGGKLPGVPGGSGGTKGGGGPNGGVGANGGTDGGPVPGAPGGGPMGGGATGGVGATGGGGATGGMAGGAAVQQSGPVQPASHSHAPHGEASVAVHVPRPEQIFPGMHVAHDSVGTSHAAPPQHGRHSHTPHSYEQTPRPEHSEPSGGGGSPHSAFVGSRRASRIGGVGRAEGPPMPSSVHRQPASQASGPAQAAA